VAANQVQSMLAESNEVLSDGVQDVTCQPLQPFADDADDVSTVSPPSSAGDFDETSTQSPSSVVDENEAPPASEDLVEAPEVETDEPLPVLSRTKTSTEFIVDLQPQSQKTKADERLQLLCAEVTALSQTAFAEDACKAVSGSSPWRLTLLCCEGQEGLSPLVGFVVYRLRTDPKFRSLSIAKIAVHPDHRQHGYGSTILSWCISRAKAQKEITAVKLCALAEVVPWYRKRGFVREMKLEDDEDHEPGQVAMAKYFPVKGMQSGKVRRR